MSKRSLYSIIAVFTLMLVAVYSISAQEAQPAATLIQSDSLIIDWVGEGAWEHNYAFEGLKDEAMLVLMEGFAWENGPAIEITNHLTGEKMASINDAVTGLCVRIAPGERRYNMEIIYNTGTMPTEQYGLLLRTIDENMPLDCPEGGLSSFASGLGVDTTLSTISLLDASGTSILSTSLIDPNGSIVPPVIIDSSNPVVTPVVPVTPVSPVDPTMPVTPVAPNTGACEISASGAVNVNVRALPRIQAGVIATVTATGFLPVIGSVAGGAWLLIDTGTSVGFAATALLDSQGDCSLIPTVTVTVDGLIEFVEGTIDLSGLIGNLDLALAAGINLGGLVGVDAGLALDNSQLVLDANGNVIGINVDLNAAVDLDGDGLLDIDLDADGLVDVNVSVDNLLDSNGDGQVEIGVGAGDTTLIDVDLGNGSDSNSGSLVDVNLGGTTTDNGSSVVNVDANQDGANVNVGGSSTPLVDVNVGGTDSNTGSLVDVNLGGTQTNTTPTNTSVVTVNTPSTTGRSTTVNVGGSSGVTIKVPGL